MSERVVVHVERAAVRIIAATPRLQLRLGSVPVGLGGAVESVDGRTGVVVLSDLYESLGTALDLVQEHVGEADPHPGYLKESGVSAYALTLLDDADAGTARATLGVVAATTSAAGLVELATSGEDAAGVAVQGEDWRLHWAQMALFLGVS